MLTIRAIDAVRRAVSAARAAGRPIGFVPTMGALHRGHESLIEASVRDRCWTIVSIFVNPTQFGPHEDFARYPRTEAADLAMCERAGVEAVFLPNAAEMYSPGAATTVHVAKLTDTLCGPHRPGHFQGVATVVAKLFNIVHPDRAYFGEKDAQQLAVIRQMVRDLDFPIEIIGAPTVREPDGLAMSSRNRMLSPAARTQATVLYRALQHGARAIRAGQRDPQRVMAEMRELIAAAGPATIDYISAVDTQTLQPVERVENRILLALAVRIGGVRLIDNMTVDA